MKAIKDIIQDNSKQLNAFIYGKSDGGIVKSEFKSLDKVIGGFLADDVVVIGARPAMGKTSFMLKMAYNQALQGKKVVFYSLDSNVQNIIFRLISFISEINSSRLTSGTVREVDSDKINEAITEIESLPLFLEDRALSVTNIVAEAEKMVKENKIDIIYIDYIQLLNPNRNKSYNRDQELSSIMNHLKQLAKKIKKPIIVSSQLSRAVETRGGDKRPILSDLRESGSIEEFADKVFFLHRAEYYGLTEDEYGHSTEGKATIIIAKNRSGNIGDVQLCFKNHIASFCDLNNVENINLLKEKLGLELDDDFTGDYSSDDDQTPF